MRPYGTSEQLAQRRQRALGWLRRGQKPAQVAKRVGTSERSVRRWQQDLKHPPRKRKRRALGRTCRLSRAQLRRLTAALKRGACAYGYLEDYWTLDRVGHLIWHLFRVHDRPNGVWYLLQRREWSCQKPQRRALQRDEAAIAHWKH